MVARTAQAVCGGDPERSLQWGGEDLGRALGHLGGHPHHLSLEHAHASWTNTFTDHLLRSCCEDYGQWEEGAVLAEDASQDVADLVKGVYSRLQHVARLAVATWRGCADQLLARTPRLLDELLCPKPVGDGVGSIVRGGG